MQFFIDPKGTTVNLISDPVYEGSTNANELVLVAPISSANQVTVTFMLPIGISTTERLLTLQNSMSIDGVHYNVWRCLLDGTITEYAGTVRVQFSIYQGSGQNIPIILNTYASSFVVSRGITPQLPVTPTPNIYENILQYLSSLNPNFNIQSVVYSAPDEYKISTGSNTNTVAKIPENLVIKSSGVDFSAGNIGAEDKTEIFPAFFACGENKSNTDVGFQINFNTATEIGRMSIYLFREYYPTALDIYAITSDGKETLVDSFISCAPSDDVICVSVNVGLDNVTSIRVIQPYDKNAEMDAKDDTISDKGFQNGRFYVQKVLFWKQNSEGYFSLISSTGRTLIIPDATYSKSLIQKSVELAAQSANQAAQSVTDAENSAARANNSAYEAAQSATEAGNAAENAVASVNNKLKVGVVKSVTVAKSADNVSIKTVTRNLESGSETQESQSIGVANSSGAGLMSKEAYSQLEKNTANIQQLKGNFIRLLYTASSAPTSDDIQSFVVSKGYTPSPSVSVVVSATNHVWRYYTGTGYKDDGVDTITQFTDNIAGVIKGSEDEGKIKANLDGTGSVVGWSELKESVNNEVAKKTTVTVGGSNVATFNADTKLDKVANPGLTKVYTAQGTFQTMLTVMTNPIAQLQEGFIPTYKSPTFGNDIPIVDGVLITNVPTKPYQCANKKYVDDIADTKLNKIENTTSYYRAYIVTTKNLQSSLPIVNRCTAISHQGMAAYGNDNVEADTAPTNKAYLVSQTPVRNYHVATKEYVDGLVIEVTNPYNENILINGEFNINQEGVTTYNISSDKVKTVDMWIGWNGMGTFNANTKVLTNNLGNTSNATLILQQAIEDYNYLWGKTLTYTVKIDGVVYSTTGTLPTDIPTAKTVYFTKNITTASGYNCYIRLRYEPSPGMIYADIALSPDSSSLTAVSSITLGFAKLEYGSIATKFRHPNIADEMLKCQRYFQQIKGFKTARTTYSFYDGYNVYYTPMRMNPTKTIYSLDENNVQSTTKNTMYNITSSTLINVTNPFAYANNLGFKTQCGNGAFVIDNDYQYIVMLDANIY